MTESNPRQNVTFASNGGQAHGYLKQRRSGSGPGADRHPGVVGSGRPHRRHRRPVRRGGIRGAGTGPVRRPGRPRHRRGRRVHAGNCPSSRRHAIWAARSTTCSPTRRSPRPRSVWSGSAWAGASCSNSPRSRATRSARPYRSTAWARACRTATAGSPRRCRATTARTTASTPSTRPASRSSRSASSPSPSVEFFYYPAGHAFHNDKDRMGTYDAESARLAWDRTVEFLIANAA